MLKMTQIITTDLRPWNHRKISFALTARLLRIFSYRTLTCNPLLMNIQFRPPMSHNRMQRATSTVWTLTTSPFVQAITKAPVAMATTWTMSGIIRCATTMSRWIGWRVTTRATAAFWCADGRRATQDHQLHFFPPSIGRWAALIRETFCRIAIISIGRGMLSISRARTNSSKDM